MSQNSRDLRVRRTQKLIREALISLIEERGFEAITVGDLANRAMVSRTAFYRYYEDKYDLVMKIFEEIVTTINSELDSLRRKVIENRNEGGVAQSQSWGELFQYSPEIITPYVILFKHIIEYERLYHALLGKQGSSWFTTHSRDYLADMVERRLRALLKSLCGAHNIPAPMLKDGFLPF